MRGDLQLRFEQTLVVAVARAEHHPVFAERHRLAVAVGGDVMDRKDWHHGTVRDDDWLWDWPGS